MNSTLTIAKSGKIKPLKRGITLHISIEERKPYLKTIVLLSNGQYVENMLLIDIGAGHPCL